jgi:hypothetical protein
MELHPFPILVVSMFCNFVVLGISINRPDSFYPVSLSAISISLQGLALRHFAIISVTWIIYSGLEEKIKQAAESCPVEVIKYEEA